MYGPKIVITNFWASFKKKKRYKSLWRLRVPFNQMKTLNIES